MRRILLLRYRVTDRKKWAGRIVFISALFLLSAFVYRPAEDAGFWTTLLRGIHWAFFCWFNDFQCRGQLTTGVNPVADKIVDDD
jgi:hypothetical protein